VRTVGDEVTHQLRLIPLTYFPCEHPVALFGLLNTDDLEEFANALANDLGRRFPPASEARTDPGAKHQVRVILEGLGARAVRYQSEHKLGLYKKAKLGNVFKWKLKDLGYSDDFAERATKEIVTRLAVNRSGIGIRRPDR
jgi:hypothetical protein